MLKVEFVCLSMDVQKDGIAKTAITIFGTGIFGAPASTQITQELTLDFGPWIEIQSKKDVWLVKRGGGTKFHAFRAPNKSSEHPKFKNLYVKTLGVESFQIGNVRITVSVDELNGIVPQHLHEEPDFVCEWQFRLDSNDKINNMTLCLNGMQHGHPSGWENHMLAVKVRASVIKR